MAENDVKTAVEDWNKDRHTYTAFGGGIILTLVVGAVVATVFGKRDDRLLNAAYQNERKLERVKAVNEDIAANSRDSQAAFQDYLKGKVEKRQVEKTLDALQLSVGDMEDVLNDRLDR